MTMAPAMPTLSENFVGIFLAYPVNAHDRYM